MLGLSPKQQGETQMKYLPLVLVAGFAGFAPAAYAGPHPSSQGGSTCSNAQPHPGECVLLQTECTGKYEEWKDDNGTTYGHCSKSKRSALKLKAK
jgi:hypothetical protein